MQIITLQQWNAMGLAPFAERLTKLIREAHPKESADITDAELRGEIARQARKARGYGMKDEQTAAAYVYTAWLLGPDCDTRIPSLAQILNEPTLPAPRKADALNNFTQTVFHALDTHAAGTP